MRGSDRAAPCLLPVPGGGGMMTTGGAPVRRHLADKGIWCGREESSLQISVFSRGSLPRHSSQAEGGMTSGIVSFFSPRLFEYQFGRDSLFFTNKKQYEGFLGVALILFHLLVC